MKEPIRYIENAKELLSKSPIEGNRYANEKYVKSACGVKAAFKTATDFLKKLK